MSCHYCQHPDAKRIGQVYCTSHISELETISNGAFMLTANNIESKEHITRFSIRFMLDGEQYYKLGNRKMRIDSNKFLVINHLNSYTTLIKAKPWENPHAIYLAYNPTFVADVYNYFNLPTEKLLDAPPGHKTIEVFEQTYERDQIIDKYLMEVRKLLMSDVSVTDVDLDNIFGLILARLFEIHFKTYYKINSLPQVKPGTKLELYKRLNLAREYIDLNIEKRLDLRETAQIASLSKFHFLRLFKEIHGITPYQYILEKKLEKSKSLLLSTKLPIQEIINLMGFKDHASFSNLYKKKYGLSPTNYRKQNFFLGMI